MLLCFSNIFSQYNNTISSGVAPWLPNKSNYYTNSVKTNSNAVGYSYYSVDSYSSQLFRYNVGTPGATTLIGSVQPYLLGNGDFANPTGVWKYYVQDQNAPFTIFEVDTATGTITSVGVPNNLKSGHKPMDMEWDHTTNTFFMISSNSALTETQLYKMYWNTKNLTWIGSSVSLPAAIIAGGFNANGTYFGIDLLSDSLWKVNKATGVWTGIGSLGYPVNYSQDAGFDRADFSKMLWCACGGAVGLYEVDTTNADINFIGSFPYTQVIASGFITGDGPQITVSKLPNTQNLSGPYVVDAVVTPGSVGIKYTKLFWSRNNTVITDSLYMTNSGGNNWSGNIPGNGSSGSYRYYGYTMDSLNRFAVSPLGAPSNLYSFMVYGADTIKPVITHTPIGSTLKTSWPVSVNATVTDNFGLDSVWVKWRKNSTAEKEFKLLNVTGNSYSALFNSLNSDVVPGDTIIYRIIAQDNSESHNKDSTLSYGFFITPGDYLCIGSGTWVFQGYPFNTSYYGSKTQMLWSASELNNVGGGEGSITKIGFDFVRADTITMNNFSIKMQSTFDSTLTGFIEYNWTTVYDSTYIPPETGWQYITLQTPYYWDGTSSIVIQICFENTIKSLYSTVRGGNTSYSRAAFEIHDLANACTAFHSPSVVSYKPNICFKIIPVLNSNINLSYYPVEYKLLQNYPNPFNPVTRILFDVKKQGFVTLKIYDILGKVVNVLVNEVKSVGQYSVDYNASCLPSGVYFYRFECNGFSDTKKMLLLK